MNFHNMFTIQFGFDKGSDIIPTIRSNLLLTSAMRHPVRACAC